MFQIDFNITISFSSWDNLSIDFGERSICFLRIVQLLGLFTEVKIGDETTDTVKDVQCARILSRGIEHSFENYQTSQLLLNGDLVFVKSSKPSLWMNLSIYLTLKKL